MKLSTVLYPLIHLFPETPKAYPLPPVFIPSRGEESFWRVIGASRGTPVVTVTFCILTPTDIYESSSLCKNVSCQYTEESEKQAVSLWAKLLLWSPVVLLSSTGGQMIVLLSFLADLCILHQVIYSKDQTKCAVKCGVI